MDWRAEGTCGVVAAGGEAAVAAGVSLLEAGGNAADAAATTILALAVTDYGPFAIGGEVPFMFYDAQRDDVGVLCGLGRAPRDEATVARFYETGIPKNGHITATPVPGAVGLCLTALRDLGTTTFAQAVAPALDLLDRHDEEWHAPLAATFRRLIDAERGGGNRSAGLRSAEDRFYRGDIARELVAFYEEKGGVQTAADLAAHHTVLEPPVSVSYRGHTVYKCGPWTQGPSLCQALRVLEGFELGAMRHLSADYVHVVAESLKLAFADRDEHYGDPAFVDVPLERLFSDEYTALRRELIDMARSSDEFRPGDPVGMKAIKPERSPDPMPGGTTTCVVADRYGNVVSATPSCNPPYETCRRTGVSHGNRLRSLNTTPDHPNRIQPGKRPRITLTPTIAKTSDGRIIAISVAGGDLQEQTALNCLLNHLEFSMPPLEAVSAPRFNTSHHQNSFDPNPDRTGAVVGRSRLVVNDGIDVAVVDELRSRGHKIETIDGVIARPVMLVFDPKTGEAMAAGDPTAKRHAAAACR
jgi:gamma-glutamyltranspeptidase/glutathione hydrolase